MTITIPPIFKNTGINEYKNIQKETDETKIQPKKDDTVIISKEAKEVQFKQKVNEAVLTAEPPSNKKRIEELKKQIENGTYMVDKDKISVIADKILDSLL